MLQDGSYSVLPRDPTPRIEREITTLLRSGDFPADVVKRLIPRNCKPPRIYGLFNIHKNNCPLRPIVSTLEYPTFKRAQYLARVLKEYTGKTSSHILNSSHFVQLISEICLNPEIRIVSFDVTSLFTKVAVAESLTLIRELLSSDGHPPLLGDLPEKCPTYTYFTFQGQF